MSPGDVVTDTILAAAHAAADVAGAVIRPYFRARLAIEDKSDASPVTVADRTAEQAMRAVLAGRFPKHGILGEEFGLERPAAGLRWVLDPIDGTRAFITGRAQFGTLIGLLADGVPILGIMDQPITGERWVGVAGRTTTFRGSFGGEVGARPCPTLATAELSCTSPEMFAPAQWTAWQRLAGSVARASFGGDCYAYGLLALGHIDVIAEADLKVWDWTALAPIVEGVGGRITDWKGAPLRGDPSGASQSGAVIAVGDPALLEPALAILAEPAR